MDGRLEAVEELPGTGRPPVRVLHNLRKGPAKTVQQLLNRELRLAHRLAIEPNPLLRQVPGTGPERPIDPPVPLSQGVAPQPSQVGFEVHPGARPARLQGTVML